MGNFDVSTSGWQHIEVASARQVDHILDEVEADASIAVPRDTNELADSIKKNYQHGELEGTVSVGTDHWAPTEYGSRPHIIRIKTKKVLANKETGEVFGKEVNHPGTPSQPFMRPSLYKKRRLRKDI